jgi:hypothetical protein
LTYQGASPKFQEWSHLTAQEPIRQGDILRAIASDGDPWRQWLIVITADCDLAHAKHDGALSCVSVLHHLDYLSRFRAEKLSASLEDRIIREILKALDAPDLPSRPQITPARMSSWITEVEPAEIISTLKISKPLQTKTLGYIQSYRDLIKAKGSGELHLLMDAFASAKVAIGAGKSKSDARLSVSKELASSLKTLPGDAIFISSLADDARDGYVAYLRRIHEVRDHDVVRSSVSIPKGAQFSRMGRLTAPYIYALTQQVGSVFGAIGLPTEYEMQRSETIELFSLLQSEEQ